MKPTELNNKTLEELTGVLSELKTKMAKFNFELEANTLKDTSHLKKTKKDIARVLTVLSSLKTKA